MTLRSAAISFCMVASATSLAVVLFDLTDRRRRLRARRAGEARAIMNARIRAVVHRAAGGGSFSRRAEP
jgi:hypothetical protein